MKARMARRVRNSLRFIVHRFLIFALITGGIALLSSLAVAIWQVLWS